MKKDHLLLFLFILCSLPMVNHAWAQSTYLVKHYPKEEYHAGSQNWSIDADDQGFVYVANNDGLLIFDGTAWKTYRNPDQTIVRSVYVAPDRRIYTGSYEEFGYWQQEATHEFVYRSLKPLQSDASFNNSEVWKIVECRNKIYFQSFSSLFVYDHKSIKSIQLPGTIIFLLKARERLFVQSVNGNLYEVVNDSLINLDIGQALLGMEVKTILPYLNNTFLIGTTSNGVFIYDGKSIRPWKNEADQELREYQINNGLVLGNQLFFGTIVKGLLILDFQGNIVYHLHNDNALQNNTVLSLCSDRNGSVWVGQDNGIDHIFLNNMVDVYQEKGEHLGAVYTAALLGNRLYVGTNRGIFTYSFNPSDQTYKYTGFLSNSQGQVWELKVIDGTLFCGHTSGTFIIEDNNLKKISPVSGGFCLQKLAAGKGDYLIQSTYAPLVIFRNDGRAWYYDKQVKGYLEPSRFLETDHFGNVWVSHAVKGLYKLQLSPTLDSVISQVSYGKNDGFPSEFAIRVFKIDHRVVFTTGSRLFTWDDLKNKVILYEDLNKQLQGFEAATRIVEFSANRYWFIRKNDIGLFEIRNNKATLLFHLYLPLYALHMVDEYENIVPLDNQRHLICLDNGFAILNTNALTQQLSDQSRLLFRNVYCQDMKGSKQVLDPAQSLSIIPHALNNLSFSFTCINSRHPTQLYQYKLEGLESSWSGWTDNTEVTYTRLPRGQFSFMVRTLTGGGKLSDPIVMHIRVMPAWYASFTAWVCYFLLALGFSLLSWYLVRRRVIRHQTRLRLEHEARVSFEKQRAEQEIIKLQNEKLQTEISHKNIQLANSTKAIINKNELLIEIKDELDRQREKLGTDYPKRYFERIHAHIKKNISNDSDWKIFEALFDQAHENFFKRLKNAYPDLTQSDLKLCAYLKLNLSSKEIAPLLNISHRGVETRRYRLRRRLALESDENLVELIMQF